MIREGDLVTIGTGRKTWRVHTLWHSGGVQLATLEPLDGYSRTTKPLSQLRPL